MSATDLPLVSMLKARMQWHQGRQKLLAENVANADTPHFRPRDLAEPRFAADGTAAPPLRGGGAAGGGDEGAFSVQVTNPMHMAGAPGEAAGATRAANRFEVVPSGNAVSLEDEMMKVAQNQADYQLAASLYQKSLQMLRHAVGKN